MRPFASPIRKTLLLEFRNQLANLSWHRHNLIRSDAEGKLPAPHAARRGCLHQLGIAPRFIGAGEEPEAFSIFEKERFVSEVL